MSKIQRVIYFSRLPVSEYDMNRYGVELMRQHFPTEVWDFSRFYDGEAAHADKQKHAGISYIVERENIESKLANLKNCFVIFMLGQGYMAYKTLRLLKKYKIKYGIIAPNPIPLPDRSSLKWLLARFSRISFNKFRDRVCEILIRKNFLIDQPCLFATAVKPNETQKKRAKNTFSIHSFDYDRFLQLEPLDPEQSNKFVVFIDQFIPSHPDYALCDEEPYCSAEDYYPMINSFFNTIEHVTRLPVIIAAHPRSDYSKSNPYEGRRIVHNESLKLIQHAKLILIHDSTAVNMCVLTGKPIIFMDSRKFAPELREYIAAMSKKLNKTPIILESQNEYKNISETTVNHEIYKKYIEKYIKSPGTEDDLFWNIFARAIRTT